MRLLEGGAAAIFMETHGPIYLDATVYKQEIVQDDGGDTTITYLEYDGVLAQVNSMDENMRAERGAADSDRKILVLCNSIVTEVTSDCEILVNQGKYAGTRFQVQSVNMDPCAARFSCRGRRSGDQA